MVYTKVSNIPPSHFAKLFSANGIYFSKMSQLWKRIYNDDNLENHGSNNNYDKIQLNVSLESESGYTKS